MAGRGVARKIFQWVRDLGVSLSLGILCMCMHFMPLQQELTFRGLNPEPPPNNTPMYLGFLKNRFRNILPITEIFKY